MRFNSKIVVFAVVPAVLFIVGLTTSISSLISTRSSFDDYLKSELEVERGLSEMYAQGLQMGQALRNVVLDPANPKALVNFKSAQTLYETAYSHTLEVAVDGDQTNALKALAPLRAAQAVAQEKVLTLVATSEQAIEVLNKEETPAWRSLRTDLLKLREGAIKASAQVHEKVDKAASTAIVLSVTMAACALLVAIALNTMLLSTVRKELGGDPEDARHALESISQGNLNSSIKNNGDDLSLMGVLNQMQIALQTLVGGVRRGSESVANASVEIAQGNNDLSARTEQQASALEETAASMEELSATVNQNADSARQANQLALSASSVAVQGGVVVNQVIETMKGINESSRKISDIISVIDGIAFQTNILALNAAVEAARAGEQGRGFAVVASEVRTLAGRSAEAAKEIKALIGASVERVEHGSALVDRAGTTMTEVVDSIKRVTDIMGEISAASNEQALGVAQVGEAVTQMDQTTQQNAALVEEMAAATSSLKGQARELVQMVAVFKVDANDGMPIRQPQKAPASSQRLTAPTTAAAAPRLAARGPSKSAASRPTLARPASPAPKQKTMTKTPRPGGDDDWETF